MWGRVKDTLSVSSEHTQRGCLSVCVVGHFMLHCLHKTDTFICRKSGLFDDCALRKKNAKELCMCS